MSGNKSNLKSVNAANGSAIRSKRIIDDNTKFDVLEAYKAARTNLMFKLNSINGHNSLVFSSYSPMDGKSTTCINMGITFAQTGAKVLIIDADMRKPVVHKYLETPIKPGLSDKLGNFVNDELCIYRTSYENLFLMPAGTLPPNPTELLVSENMSNLLNTLSPLFDYILVDAPPIGIVTDAAVIGSKTKGVVMVLKGSKTRTEHVKDSIDSLEKAGARLIGCVLNSFNKSGKSYKHKKYDRYYRYSDTSNSR